jgi:phosphoribosylformylglycinamidine cyclo-ligase
MSITYQQSGVNISAGNDAVQRIKGSVQSTYTKNVLTSLGGFAGAYDIHEELKNYKHPILVQSTDSVGTKVMVAKMMRKYDTIGRDLVGNVVGDILVMGAKPLTFLDYLANYKTKPDIIEQIVSGIAYECNESGMSLIGGEIAEMPGVYEKGEVDVVGFVTGVVEKNNIITGKNIQAGDVVIGLPSSGIHTNGFSLARKILFDIGKLGVESTVPELDKTIGETLLEPHINYTKQIQNLLSSDVEIKGMAHITGGGLIENIPRILPNNCAVEIKKKTWQRPVIFDVIQQIGAVEEHEMYRTFNMGIGIVIVTDESQSEKLSKKYNCIEIGYIKEGQKDVKFI